MDQIITSLAHRHGGAVSSRLLLENGVGRRSISRHTNSGALCVVTKGHFVVESLRQPNSEFHALALAYPTGAIARESAAARLGFQQRPSAKHFLVPHSTSVTASGIRIHETRSLPEADVTMVDGLRTTSSARTLCDIAPSIEDRRLIHLVETQLSKKRPSQEALLRCVEDRTRRGVAGMSRFARLLSEIVDDEPFPESALELLLLKGLNEVGIVGLHRQFQPPWYDGIRGVVDVADAEGRTIIEADGRQFRQVTQAHDNDRQRDRKAAAHGYLVIRVGHRELRRSRFVVLSEIAEIIQQRRVQADAA